VSPESIAPAISSHFVQLFVEAAIQEVGAENLPRVLEKFSLLPSVIEKDSLEDLNGIQEAELYALLQQALRHFYGRGARGILLRIGYENWERITRRANILEKAELEVGAGSRSRSGGGACWSWLQDVFEMAGARPPSISLTSIYC